MKCHDCQGPIDEKSWVDVYGVPGAHRCAACMRVRLAAAEIAAQHRGDKRLQDRGHTADSGFRRGIKPGCVVCGALDTFFCQPCRELGEAYWAEA